MSKSPEISITISALGTMIALMGLFPGIVGLETTEGVGVLQVLVILLGFSLLFTGAYIFVKQTFYSGLPTTLAQDIGIRLTMTGLLIAAAAGLADVLGFGSHTPTPESRPLLGNLQAVAFVGSILLASFGVILYALMGPAHQEIDPADSEEESGSIPPESR